MPLRDATKKFERKFILEHLHACRWNRSLVARRLGIQRKTLYLKMQQLNIQDSHDE
jgi:two-component system response regulator AtoC